MPRLTGPASVIFLSVVTLLTYGLRLRVNPLPLPIYLILTIIFITASSILVSYLAARAYLKERRPSILFVGSGSLIFGLTSLVAGIFAVAAGLNGSNPATTTFILGTCLSSGSHLMGVGLRPLGNKHAGGPKSVVLLTFATVLVLTSLVIVAAFERFLPAFLIPGVGLTPIAVGLLAVAITALGLASLILVVSNSVSAVLYWYAYALATAAVGLFGTLLSNWAFQAVDFVVGRTVLCLAGAFMVMSVRAAEKYAVVDPDSVLEELFQPITAEPQAPPARKEGGRETDDRWLYQRSMLLEVDPSSNYERAVRGFALEMASNGRELFVFTTSSSAVRVLLRDIPEIRFLILSDVSYPKASDRPLDVLVPSYDLAAILSVINETVTKAPGARKAIVFDNISSLIVELGFQNTYKFLKHVNEVLAQGDMISLFMMLAKAHDDSEVKLIRNLYSGHLTYDANGLGVTK